MVERPLPRGGTGSGDIYSSVLPQISRTLLWIFSPVVMKERSSAIVIHPSLALVKARSPAMVSHLHRVVANERSPAMVSHFPFCSSEREISSHGQSSFSWNDERDTSSHGHSSPPLCGERDISSNGESSQPLVVVNERSPAMVFHLHPCSREREISSHDQSSVISSLYWRKRNLRLWSFVFALQS